MPCAYASRDAPVPRQGLQITEKDSEPYDNSGRKIDYSSCRSALRAKSVTGSLRLVEAGEGAGYRPLNFFYIIPFRLI